MNIMKANTQGLSLELRITAFGLILKELLIFLWDPNSLGQIYVYHMTRILINSRDVILISNFLWQLVNIYGVIPVKFQVTLITLSGPNEFYNRTDLQKICLMISWKYWNFGELILEFDSLIWVVIWCEYFLACLLLGWILSCLGFVIWNPNEKYELCNLYLF